VVADRAGTSGSCQPVIERAGRCEYCGLGQTGQEAAFQESVVAEPKLFQPFDFQALRNSADNKPIRSSNASVGNGGKYITYLFIVVFIERL
jgi:hypothetical protein